MRQLERKLLDELALLRLGAAAQVAGGRGRMGAVASGPNLLRLGATAQVASLSSSSRRSTASSSASGEHSRTAAQ